MIKIKDNRKYFFNLYQQLNYFGDIKGSRFALIIVKNANILEQEVKKVQDMAKSSPEYKIYDSERAAICEKYAEKDKDGNAVVVEKDYKIDETNKEVFDKELAELKEKNKDLIDARATQSVEVEEYADEEIELALYQIPLKLVPDTITVDLMKIIQPLIQE